MRLGVRLGMRLGVRLGMRLGVRLGMRLGIGLLSLYESWEQVLPIPCYICAYMLVQYTIILKVSFGMQSYTGSILQNDP